MDQKLIRTEIEESLGLVFLDRPKALNALGKDLVSELVGCLASMERDERIRVIILTGNQKVFSAGADIEEMSEMTSVDMLVEEPFEQWAAFGRIQKPIIAAVSGVAFGGGCELAMACDMIIASETARFGLPEVSLGVIPGAGGTQRLPRALGKYKAMEMILGAEAIGAEEAYRRGLVNRVVPVEVYLEEAKKLARQIAAKPPLAVKLAKQSVQAAFETSLDEGLRLERKNFYLLFATTDQKEGMKAFLEKRQPKFVGR